jgi:hypothetical protein
MIREFNSLDAQREACEAYIKSQAHEGWRLIPGRYDDGAFSGASLDRPALQQLLADVRAGKIDIVLVYKVDRLTRSLADFAKLIELFDVPRGQQLRHVFDFCRTLSGLGRFHGQGNQNTGPEYQCGCFHGTFLPAEVAAPRAAQPPGDVRP